jgi:hypothetical protein
MIYNGTAGILSQNGNALTQRIKSLTYQVQGSYFPQGYYNFGNDGNVINGNERATFISSDPNSVTINYGDGTVVVKQFEQVSGDYVFGYDLGDETGSHIIPQHQFTDGFTGIRNITFEFEKPLSLNEIQFAFIQLRGSLPYEVSLFSNLKIIQYSFGSYVQTQPDTFPGNLQSLTLANIFQQKKTIIPDSVFESNITTLSAAGSYNLADNISSNFFKINQLKDSLSYLDFTGCEINQLPVEISECVELEDLRITGNNFSEIPTEIGSLVNLNRLYLGGGQLENNSLKDWNNLNKLENLWLPYPSIDLSGMPQNWSGLKSLSSFLFFKQFINSSERFDEFIEHFYSLCTTNAYLDVSSAPGSEQYPEQFRNISWGHGTLSFTGVKQAPVGYQQGVSNGNAQTNGEKVYVLQNQLGHTITHA